MNDKFPIDPDKRREWIKECVNTIESELSRIHDLSLEMDFPEFEPPLADHFEKTEEFYRRCLDKLESIEKNTANLYAIVDLISKSGEKQDVLLDLIFEILTIAKAKDKNEAESLYKEIIKKINGSVEIVDSIIKLTGWAGAIYKFVSSMI